MRREPKFRDLVLPRTLDRRAVLALGAGASLAAASPTRAQPVAGGALRVAMSVPPLRDPRLFDLSEMANIARGVIEPLVRLEVDGTLAPWLLAGWEIAPKGDVYVLRLRRGVRWSNGDAFDARDVLFNIARWCEADAPGNSMAARFSALIDPQTRRLRAGAAEALDAHTVRLTLSRPDVTLIAAMADYPALIVHRGFDASGADFAANPVGTGPFRLERLEPGIGARVARPERPWWGGAVYLDAVEWVDLGVDQSRLVSAFAAGEIDLNHSTEAAFAPALDALGLTAHEALSGATAVARMRVDAPPYGDRRIRRALQRMVDNETVLAIGHGGRGLPAENHHVGPMHPEHTPLPPPPRDPQAAMALLAEAGSSAYPFELISIDDDWRRLTADVIVAQMRDGGLDARRRIEPARAFWENWRRYPFSVTDWAMRPLGVQTLSLAYRSDAAWNETGFGDPVFDALLDEAMGAADLELRRALTLELERLLQDSGVIIQPYWRSVAAHAAARVRGFRLHPAQEQHLERVWLEPL